MTAPAAPAAPVDAFAEAIDGAAPSPGSPRPAYTAPAASAPPPTLSPACQPMRLYPRFMPRRTASGIAPNVPVRKPSNRLAVATATCPGGGRIFGLDGLFAAQGRVLTLVAPPNPTDAARAKAEVFLSSIGLRAEWIGDGAGLVLPRIMSMLANEAAFALAEGTADESTIDLAMKLGANYPIGPLAWLRQVGAPKVLRVLEHLRAVFAEERYRVAPLLRRWADEDQRR